MARVRSTKIKVRTNSSVIKYLRKSKTYYYLKIDHTKIKHIKINF